MLAIRYNLSNLWGKVLSPCWHNKTPGYTARPVLG